MQEGGVGSIAQGMDLLGFDGLFNSAVRFMDVSAVGEFAVRGIRDKVGKGEENIIGGDVIYTKAFDSRGIYAEAFSFKGKELCGGSGM